MAKPVITAVCCDSLVHGGVLQLHGSNFGTKLNGLGSAVAKPHFWCDFESGEQPDGAKCVQQAWSGGSWPEGGNFQSMERKTTGVAGTPTTTTDEFPTTGRLNTTACMGNDRVMNVTSNGGGYSGRISPYSGTAYGRYLFMCYKRYYSWDSSANGTNMKWFRTAGTDYGSGTVHNVAGFGYVGGAYKLYNERVPGGSDDAWGVNESSGRQPRGLHATPGVWRTEEIIFDLLGGDGQHPPQIPGGNYDSGPQGANQQGRGDRTVETNQQFALFKHFVDGGVSMERRQVRYLGVSSGNGGDQGLNLFEYRLPEHFIDNANIGGVPASASLFNDNVYSDHSLCRLYIVAGDTVRDDNSIPADPDEQEGTTEYWYYGQTEDSGAPGTPVKREIQLPREWNGNMVTAEVNAGDFSTLSDKYVMVVNDNNEYSDPFPLSSVVPLPGTTRRVVGMRI